MKYYAVKCGRERGIFTNWEEVETSINGYSGAEFKSFKKEEDALIYLGRKENLEEKILRLEIRIDELTNENNKLKDELHNIPIRYRI